MEKFSETKELTEMILESISLYDLIEDDEEQEEIVEKVSQKIYLQYIKNVKEEEIQIKNMQIQILIKLYNNLKYKIEEPPPTRISVEESHQEIKISLYSFHNNFHPIGQINDASKIDLCETLQSKERLTLFSAFFSLLLGYLDIEKISRKYSLSFLELKQKSQEMKSLTKARFSKNQTQEKPIIEEQYIRKLFPLSKTKTINFSDAKSELIKSIGPINYKSYIESESIGFSEIDKVLSLKDIPNYLFLEKTDAFDAPFYEELMGHNSSQAWQLYKTLKESFKIQINKNTLYIYEKIGVRPHPPYTPDQKHTINYLTSQTITLRELIQIFKDNKGTFTGSFEFDSQFS